MVKSLEIRIKGIVMLWRKKANKLATILMFAIAQTVIHGCNQANNKDNDIVTQHRFLQLPIVTLSKAKITLTDTMFSDRFHSLTLILSINNTDTINDAIFPIKLKQTYTGPKSILVIDNSSKDTCDFNYESNFGCIQIPRNSRKEFDLQFSEIAQKGSENNFILKMTELIRNLKIIYRYNPEYTECEVEAHKKSIVPSQSVLLDKDFYVVVERLTK